ncbi:MAG: replication-associated recombination protein A [Armatimonadetes bacterium]|nr:replication-associated recombination protein A [Armatimonadota bacterium]
MSLFDPASDRTAPGAPLAVRMRPRALGEVVGQAHLLGEGKLLRRLIESDELVSLLLFGPPGTGKTTLARVVAEHTSARFVPLNAVTAGVADVRKAVQEAADARRFHGQRTILFIDEIHRFNKAQQDLLLPYVENGTVTLIGATTGNPYFEVNPTLLSRARVLRLEVLGTEDLRALVQRALADPERGLGARNATLTPAAVDHLIDVANGDARIALNALEVAVMTTTPDEHGARVVTVERVEDAMQRRLVRYDGTGDEHYNTISAFIKGMRGSDPDAAVYWLARMLHAGEDPRLIVRRMVIQAAEDVGNADPVALLVATAAAQAVELVGLPEAQIPMAQAAIYIACAPKSNAAYRAIAAANDDVANLPAHPVPAHLRDAHYRGAKALGHGIGYEYPHDHPGGYVPQQYLPDNVAGRRYYEPTDRGREAAIEERLRRWRDTAATESEPQDAGASKTERRDAQREGHDIG